MSKTKETLDIRTAVKEENSSNGIDVAHHNLNFAPLDCPRLKRKHPKDLSRRILTSIDVADLKVVRRAHHVRDVQQGAIKAILEALKGIIEVGVLLGKGNELVILDRIGSDEGKDGVDVGKGDIQVHVRAGETSAIQELNGIRARDDNAAGFLQHAEAKDVGEVERQVSLDVKSLRHV